MVARSRSFRTRDCARPGVPSATVMVRRLGRGLGSSFRGGHGFRPLVSRRAISVHQRQGVLGHRESSVIFRSTNSRLRGSLVSGQLHRYLVSPESGRYQVSAAECHSAADSSLGGGSAGVSSSTIHYGSPQRSSGCSISTQSDLGLRVDLQGQSFSGSEEEVAGVHRPVCHLTQSPMFSAFFTIPRSERLSYGCSAPELEWVAGVCLSSLVAHSGSPQEAPVVLWGPSNTHSSVLASAAVVPELLDLVVDGPVALPLSRDLLRQPHFHRHHLGVSGLLLHTWRLSSDLPRLRASPSM